MAIITTVDGSGNATTTGSSGGAGGSSIPSRSVVYCSGNQVPSASANAMQNTYIYWVGTTGTTGNAGFTYRFQFPGAVVGVSLTNSASPTVSNLVGIAINGAQGASINVGAANVRNTAQASFPVTAYPYAVGDVLEVYTGVATASAYQHEVYVTIQWTA